ncbi:MAG: serine/threonine protein kinase, partial [Deltaproteobacteria bacterium]|nr:serine/threonine protein kinase [Deltaproteobacteria bacterium]
MKLAAGTRLGPYEIEHAIGAGGMGVVYRADDSRLRRKVAIKVLPSAAGENFRRFEREARTIGALNHPNLLTLYDVGTHDGTPFLVTEMLDGESLRSRLAKGKLKLREAIVIAADVARGLGAAHDAGVVHRDVKPDNIFLTTEGRTKILDFGIAKLRRSTLEMEATTADPDIAHEPTQSPQTADTGMVVGTPGYMAPEQLDGGKIDERTDIFALGVVFYEMIAGKRAFWAENAVEESYAILKATPDPPKGATKSAARVVMRCLEKRPDARFQSARDLAFALDELDASTDPIARISKTAIADDRLSAVTIRDASPPVMVTERSRKLRLVGIVVLLAIATGLAGVLIGRKLAGPRGLTPAWPGVVEGGAVYRRVTYHSQPTWSARLANDGRSVIYSTTQGGKEQVMRMQIDTPSIAATGIAGRLVDISQKGELAILTDDLPGTGGTLSRVMEGGGPRPVSDRVTSATWLPDETLAAIREELTIEAPLGTVIVKHTAGKLAMLRASRDGSAFAFARHPASGDTQGHVVIVDRSGTQIASSSEQAGIEGIAWSLDGSEVWFSNGPTIFALDRRGKERVVLRGIIRQVLVDVDAGKILVAPSDVRLKMFTGPRRGGSYREVGWFDASEVDAVSRDGATIAFVEAGGTGLTKDGYAAFLRRADGLASQLTNAYRVALLPDASAAIVVSGADKLLRVPTGVGKPAPLSLGAIHSLDIGDRIAMAWSGQHVVVRGAETGKSMRLWR